MEKMDKYTKHEKFKVLIIEENEEDLYKVLGISEERAFFIEDTVMKIVDAIDEKSSKSEVYKEIYDNLQHINEVVMANEIFVTLLQRKKLKNLENIFKQL